MILDFHGINGIYGRKILDKFMKNIIILGHRGMLGNYVYTYLKSKDHNIFTYDKTNLDAEFFDETYFKKEILNKNIHVVINCIGLIKPQVDKCGAISATKINSIFPRQLSDLCESNNIKFIHITTDCVYSGTKGKYIESDTHDAIDIYGKTKSLGEPHNATVIRTSIIGEEKYNKRSLVEWIKSNKGKTINGFENHIWNGVTCLQLSKTIEKIISQDLFWNGVKHIYSNEINKHELLSIVNEIYDLDITINKINASNLCNRSLSSIYKNEFDIPPLYEQIKEMKNYSLIFLQ